MNDTTTLTTNFQSQIIENRVKTFNTTIQPEEATQRFSTAGSDEEDLDELLELPQKDIFNYRKHTTDAEAIFCTKFDPEDEFIAAGSSTGLVTVFSVYGTAKQFWGSNSRILSESGTDPITSLRWDPKKDAKTGKHVLMTSSSNGTITQWDITSGKILYSFQEKNENVYLDYNKEGTLFATGGKDKKVRVYDDTTKQLKQTLQSIPYLSPGHVNRIYALKFHPEDPNILLSAGWDRLVYLWDLRTDRPMGSIYGPSTISGESIDIQGNTVLTGSYRSFDQLELWDYGTKKKIRGIDWQFEYPMENAFVFSCQFSKFNNESIIAGCSRLNQVKLFDRRDEDRDFAKIENGNSAVFCTDFANKNDFFCYGGQGGAVKVAKIILKNDN